MDFTDVYTAYFSRLSTIACIWVTPQDAEDVAQEALVRIWQDWDKMQFVDDLFSYAFTMVKNHCLDKIKHLKMARAHHVYLKANRQLATEHYSPLTYMEYQETEQRLRQAIGNLKGRSRQVFLLSREEGMKYHEIAYRLGISVNTVECQMVSALKLIRKQMNVA